MRTRQSLAAGLPVAGVAVIAGVISYGHIEALGIANHQTLTAARMLPFSVDFLIVAGSVIVLAGYWLGWLAVVAGVVATVFANLESGLPYGPLAATVATWPAIAFTVASIVLERWLKRQAGRGGREVATCGHEVAGTPEQRVVQDYLHSRDCLGETPSQRKLAATHGLHRTKVAALVGPLNGRTHE